MNEKTVYVAGTFDNSGGKFSKIAQQVFEQVKTENIDYRNGGYFRDLENIIDKIEDYKTVYWFPNVSNEEPKLVEEIKKRNESSILATSKRNIEKKYSFQQVIQHALRIKSNLLLEFSEKDKRYCGRIEDPLGNVFVDYSNDFSLIGKVLNKRVNELKGFTRVHSKNIGKAIQAPDEKEFFDIVKEYGNKFHDLIHPVPEATERFFGNASFRCERGFPSFKKEGNIFVSRRNVDKRSIGRESFVAVEEGLPVKYLGDNKPSVDTPIQLKLYDFYPNVKYMIHSHTYVRNAPFTSRIIPCGAVEEADEIITMLPDSKKTNFSVNLKGHGSIVLVDSVEKLRGINYVPRPMPEVHRKYAKEFINKN